MDFPSDHSVRWKFIFVLFLLMCSGLMYRAVDLMLNKEHTDRANLVIMNRNLFSLRQLQEHNLELKSMIARIDDYSFSEIKSALQKTVLLTKNANIEIDAQYEAWNEVKNDIRADSGALTELRQRLEKLQSIQDEEILHLKKMLDEAQRPSIADNMFSYFLTFLLGVVTSIIANMIYRPFMNSIRAIFIKLKIL